MEEGVGIKRYGASNREEGRRREGEGRRGGEKGMEGEKGKKASKQSDTRTCIFLI